MEKFVNFDDLFRHFHVLQKHRNDHLLRNTDEDTNSTNVLLPVVASKKKIDLNVPSTNKSMHVRSAEEYLMEVIISSLYK